MRVSQFYGLNRDQGTLDFVDLDLTTDIPVFLSPRALSYLPTPWAQECISLIQNYFQHVLGLIKNGENSEAESLLSMLREPNETHLGLSVGRPAGRALGNISAHSVWNALSQSDAARSGLIEDMEDTVLLVFGISKDKISDMTTNIIRGPLISYTKDICKYYGIPVQEGVNSGPVWNPNEKKWQQGFVELPVAGDYGKLILVPKCIVRLGLAYDGSEYYRHYLLERMRDEEEKAGTSLVSLIKSGPRRGLYGVTKRDLIEKYGQDKEAIVEQTLRFPDVLQAYKSAKDNEPFFPLSNSQLEDVGGVSEAVKLDDLFKELTKTPTGNASAGKFEDAIERILSALFYPSLTSPEKQTKIHQGRKIVDITYANVGVSGFFDWLQRNYPAGHIFVECKNYGQEVANPELDQLSGRFSPSRGKFGLLVCRSVNNFDLLMQRCIDTANDNRGFIVPITDNDIEDMISSALDPNSNPLEFPLLMHRFRKLIM